MARCATAEDTMRKLAGFIAAASIFTTFSATAFAADWRGWNIHVPDYPTSVAMDAFGKLVSERTQGRINPKTYHSAQLGQQDEAIQQIQLGAIDFAVFNLVPFNNIVKESIAFTLPYVFTSVDHMHKVVDGPIGAEVGKAFEEKNIVVLAYQDAGARNFYNSKHEVKTPADLKGMKIRIQSSDMNVAMIAALGANGSPIPYGEVFTALQQGVVDGAENNWPSYEEAQHFQVAKYYTVDEHVLVPEILVVAKAVWDGLSKEDQEIVRQAAIESSQLERKLWAEREKTARQKVEAGGAIITDNIDKAPWKAAMAPVYDKYGSDPTIKHLMEEISTAQ
jgi:tripartite ATP-independent transporter DctP family solute receptor